jgi:hypothetical protein
VINALQLYQSCKGPLNSILHYPYEGSVLEQPAKLIDFFQKIQYYIIESQDDNDGVSEPDPEQEAQEFQERMSQLKGN